ncbi:uncharacterized protein KY384_007873 [Bacidia gigantensis]|uniref:uncharacterized protein n=1 Tax=Bacidia gigantensis TaxID=2732470 RepID=UPI001D04F2A7|nr:uncharacterized protein KY384_007873 [Bacidia gigantensis]KAG8527719.1 hypothetical protein KY384_007873 [Bacidia gigantensis]
MKRESSATVNESPRPYVQASPPRPHQVIVIDCRGLEFIEFKAEGEWTAKGFESVTKFAGIDLQEGEWYDYDEKTSEEVSIKDIKWAIKRA